MAPRHIQRKVPSSTFSPFLPTCRRVFLLDSRLSLLPFVLEMTGAAFMQGHVLGNYRPNLPGQFLVWRREYCFELM